MSLLTSPHTHPQHLIFLNKLQNQRNKAATTGSQRQAYKSQRRSHAYSHSQHQQPKALSQTQRIQLHIQKNKISTKVPEQANQRINQALINFNKQIESIVKKYPNMVDYYHCLSVMRNSQFFSDVANLLNVDIMRKNYETQKALIQVKTMSQYWKKEYKKIAQQMQAKKKIQTLKDIDVQLEQSSGNKYISSSSFSMSRKIYYKARVLNQNQFIDFYDRIALSNKIQIKNIVGKQKVNEKTDQKLSEQVDKLLKILQSQKEQKHEYIGEILLRISDILKISQDGTCRRPCCRSQQQQTDSRPNKAKSIMKNNQSKHFSHIYKTDKSEQYFTRYYRDKSFDVNKITSVQKTKLQEMQKIQEQYKRNYQRRSRHKGISRRYGTGDQVSMSHNQLIS